uniref:Transforming acidic coiled-coil-containing protein C-terminal domain-containing protein n=1 Tax=Meleagris gallopavo TaxID=9103 RepID=A0A803YN13_MELGA
MRKIVAEYEKTIAQMIEDEQRTNMTSQKNLQQLTMEKEQALADLNSVERSLSDLFRRYENLKGVLEGFKKNEEALKKCAQDYLNRVKQEEQRYQALKVHAEEKLDKANEEIAQVRTKAKAESAALHAGLRKEQMKVESLERALQQKQSAHERSVAVCRSFVCSEVPVSAHPDCSPLPLHPSILPPFVLTTTRIALYTIHHCHQHRFSHRSNRPSRLP